MSDEHRGNVILLCAVAFIASIAYPPWVSYYAVEPASCVIERRAVTAHQVPASSQLVGGTDEYGWLWEPPTGRYSQVSQTPVAGIRPDLVRLSMEWLGIAVVFGLAFMASRPANTQVAATGPTAKPSE